MDIHTMNKISMDENAKKAVISKVMKHTRAAIENTKAAVKALRDAGYVKTAETATGPSFLPGDPEEDFFEVAAEKLGEALDKEKAEQVAAELEAKKSKRGE